MPISEIATILSAINGAKDIAKAMSDLRDATAIQTKVIELQGQILEAQSAALDLQQSYISLQDQIAELNKEIASFETWETESRRYELQTICGNGFAYGLKDSKLPGEPDHWICAKCFEDRKKSVLQKETRSPGRLEVYVCHRCSSVVYARGMRDMKHP